MVSFLSDIISFVVFIPVWYEKEIRGRNFKSGRKANVSKALAIAGFSTGNCGEFSIRLSPGKYSIIVEEKLSIIISAAYLNANQLADEKCLPNAGQSHVTC